MFASSRWRLRVSAVAVASLVPALTAIAGPASATAAVFDTAPAVASLQRLLPAAQAGQITLVPAARTGRQDSYSVSGAAGAVRVAGTSPATLLAGVGWYLAHVAMVDVGLTGDSLGRLPATLPAVPAPVTLTSAVAHRYALNDTDDGYSGPYRDFASYQREIDLLALHGINEVFVQVGAELPYYQAFQRFGYTGAELRGWFPAPAHQPWWLLQNLSGFGGPESDQLVAARGALGARVTGQLRALGMTPVLPGYFGTVPPGFAGRNPGANVVPQGDWAGFARPDWLDPTNPVFARVAAAYYAAQRADFGDSGMYKMDLLHEGGNPGQVDVGSAAHAVQQALVAAHPGATWAILGWQNNPSAALLSGVDRTGMLIVDGLSDRYDNLDRETTWQDTPYAFGSIPNFGGHTTIGANTGVWVTRFRQWLTKPHSALAGIAYLPEGTGGNPAAFELLADLAWQPGQVDQARWFADYAARRYGGADPSAAAAWDQLRRGPYSMPSGAWSEPQDSLFSARPALTVGSAAAWSPTSLRYDPGTVTAALRRLLAVAPGLRGTDAYRFDLVDTARQALANRSRTLLPLISAAYTAGDLTRFRALVGEWAREEALLDQVVGSDRRFLLGPWLAAARGQGATPAERDQLEYDARSILTTWGARSGSETGLHDYANREWSGLVGGLYAKRWDAYFASLDTALVNHTTPAAIDWFAFEDAWAHQTTSYPVTPSGDPVALASAVAALAPTGPVTGIGGACVDVTNGSSSDSTPLQLYGCNGTAAQAWTLPGDGTVRALGSCMDVRGGATTAGTTVQLYQCNGTPAQSWAAQPNGTLRNTKSALCLDASGGSSADHTPLIVWTCTGTANQVWRLPS
ncbi:alpha-N-acetylglucosaminidase [Solihabitans fulvus]|uniref:Alpha-N-acetylglucosaminidase n=1 Tax=Solihabitans fulvus TaxID=1892852 RepID=A0A5B2X2Z9_9PSEU|nr:alpha-N-acetylglucosaminidase TIM-barrel domain-containing protein [Solihabitans fulvus]KAA2257559.1 alpha-N-acetylglucosaminidase [Solihabitans fulvus]